MTLHSWWLFIVAVFLLSGTPGPNMLHVMTRSLTYGAGASVAAMAGCLAAVVLALTASAAGLAALLTAMPGAFTLLRWCGAAYLLYLGVKAWRSATAPLDVGAPNAVLRAPSRAALFRGGFAIGISNPKLLLFRRRLPAAVRQSCCTPGAAVRSAGGHFRSDRVRLVRRLCAGRTRAGTPSCAAHSAPCVRPGDRRPVHPVRCGAPGQALSVRAAQARRRSPRPAPRWFRAPDRGNAAPTRARRFSQAQPT